MTFTNFVLRGRGIPGVSTNHIHKVWRVVRMLGFIVYAPRPVPWYKQPRR